LSKLLILGAGGHGKVVAECALFSGIYKKIAFLDDDQKVRGKLILGSCSVIGAFRDAEALLNEFPEAFVALGNNKSRVELIQYLKNLGFRIPSLIYPTAYVSRFSYIGIGTIIMAGAVVNANAWIGVGGIINTSASVDHDCVLGRGVHLSPGARLGGMVTVGDFSWICIGACVVNNVCVGEGTVVAAGASVIGDVGNRMLVGGVPARELKRLD